MADAGAGGEREAMAQRIIQRSMEDEAFRQQLLEDPKAAVEQELGTRLPAEVKVRAVEGTADTVYLVIPPAAQSGEAGELSDRDLEAVAGGGWGNAGTGFPTDALHPECC